MPELTKQEYETLYLEFCEAIDKPRSDFMDAVFEHFHEHEYPVVLGTKMFMDLMKLMLEVWNKICEEYPDDVK